MMSNSNGFKPGESVVGTPMGMPNEGNGLYAPIKHHDHILHKKLEKIHNQLAKKGIHPFRIEPGRDPLSLKPYMWGSTK